MLNFGSLAFEVRNHLFIFIFCFGLNFFHEILWMGIVIFLIGLFLVGKRWIYGPRGLSIASSSRKGEYVLIQGWHILWTNYYLHWVQHFLLHERLSPQIPSFLQWNYEEDWLLQDTWTPLHTKTHTNRLYSFHNAFPNIFHNVMNPFHQSHFFLNQLQILDLQLSDLCTAMRWLWFFIDNADKIVLIHMGDVNRMAFR